jgi:hypothetical protein
MTDQEYLIMAKVTVQANPDDPMNALMDLELLDHILALQRTHSLMSQYTAKGNRRKNSRLSEQINNLIDHDIKERYAMGIMPRRFWLRESYTGNHSHPKPPYR